MASNHYDYESYYERYLQSVQTRVREAVNREMKNVWKEFFITADARVREIFNDVVQNFYGSYSTTAYDRNESLYDLLQTEVTDDSFSLWFEPGNMTAFRSGYSGEDGLYDQVFRRGWHGGAGSGDGHPDNGTPYWRTPVPYFTHWGRPAEIAPISPLDDMILRIEDYQQNEMQADFNSIVASHLGNLTLDF